jgi:O-antigen biosynthesis protein
VGKGTACISVIICAYTDRRWDDLAAAVESLRRQTLPPSEVIVVIDHNPALADRARRELVEVVVAENEQAAGLSGARNSGIAIASSPLIAFIDDDAIADERWLEELASTFENPSVVGAGGVVEPMWMQDRPAWFPEEFQWVVGCSYRGLPESRSPVRNMIGCNMCFRKEVFQAVGEFSNGIGRVGSRPVGCEETELCIRIRQQWPHSAMLYEPRARIRHRVPGPRAHPRYFLSRCYAEGISKALVAHLVGTKDGLAAERTYTTRILPRGVQRGLADFVLRGDVSGLGRAIAIVAGLTWTAAGYAAGKAQLARRGGLSVPGISRGRRRRSTSLVARGEAPGPRGGVQSTPEKLQTFPLAGKNFSPVCLVDVDLDRPIPAVHHDKQSGKIYDRALLLVRLHTELLGTVEVPLSSGELSPHEVAAAISSKLGDRVRQHLHEDGLSSPEVLSSRGISMRGTPRCLAGRRKMLAAAPFVTVAVPTRDRDEILRQMIESLLALEYPRYEILIVDNAPRTDAAARVVASFARKKIPIRYVREDLAGISYAKNRGLAEASGEIIAFTDDDVNVDPHWLSTLVLGFQAGSNVACVTGMIFPMEIETWAQGLIEQFGGFSKGFERRLFDMAENRPHQVLYPYAAGIFGSGANMAFRTAILRQLGGFDPALGAGAPATGGEDLAICFDTVMAGYQIAYEPSAIVRHAHRREYDALRRQVHGYGVGLTAYLTKTLIDHPRRIPRFLMRLPAGVAYALSSDSNKNRGKQRDYPRELTLDEMRGALYGPIGYLYSRRRVKKLRFASYQPAAVDSRVSAPSSETAHDFGPQPGKVAGGKPITGAGHLSSNSRRSRTRSPQEDQLTVDS